jgi:hypothetical protein
MKPVYQVVALIAHEEVVREISAGHGVVFEDALDFLAVVGLDRRENVLEGGVGHADPKDEGPLSGAMGAFDGDAFAHFQIASIEQSYCQ